MMLAATILGLIPMVLIGLVLEIKMKFFNGKYLRINAKRRIFNYKYMLIAQGAIKLEDIREIPVIEEENNIIKNFTIITKKGKERIIDTYLLPKEDVNICIEKLNEIIKISQSN